MDNPKLVPVNKHLNAMGGVRILDIMLRAEIKQETLKYIDYIMANPKLIPIKNHKRIFKKD
ncbi:hypothetical protein [Ligilactobacillus agilis]|uniref:hypothetical protein n=1 Tax=Ligilactobacillus agilis TaxID=1601 RepID=UPI0018672D83|nr:hypothetical protein [Ligilactobacillus agilis]